MTEAINNKTVKQILGFSKKRNSACIGDTANKREEGIRHNYL